MSVNAQSLAFGAQKSAIREIAAYAAQRKAAVGPENVYDFSLGNPSIPAPAQVAEAIIAEAALIEERAEKLDRMMERLPQVQREAVEMKYLKEMSHDEMQRQLGMTSANVYTTLSRAISNLKTMMNHGR